MIDDFNDCDDVDWTHHDLTGPGSGPGQYNLVPTSPEGCEYNLASTGPIVPGTGDSVISSWTASLPPSPFDNGYLRAKVRAETDTTFVFLVMRGNVDELTSYEFGAIPATGEFVLFATEGGIRGLDSFYDPQMEFTVGEDWIFEAGAVGNQLSLKVWRDGDPEPAVPQLNATDSAFSSGIFGLGTAAAIAAPEPGIVSATFDDVFFTVPEPATISMLLLAGLALLNVTRRR